MKIIKQSYLKQTLAAILLVSSLLANPSVFAQCNAYVAPSKPDSLYQDNLDGTVTDIGTGLMWQKCSIGKNWNTGSDSNDPSDDSCDGNSTGLTWQVALESAQNANTNSAFTYTDWYLPNAKELVSLIDPACFPGINQTVFPGSSDAYWSATPYAGDASEALLVDPSWGVIAHRNKTSTGSVRLVRLTQ